MFEAGFFLALSKKDTSKSYFGAATCSPSTPMSLSVSKSLSVSLATDLQMWGKKSISF